MITGSNRNFLLYALFPPTSNLTIVLDCSRFLSGKFARTMFRNVFRGAMSLRTCSSRKNCFFRRVISGRAGVIRADINIRVPSSPNLYPFQHIHTHTHTYIDPSPPSTAMYVCILRLLFRRLVVVSFVDSMCVCVCVSFRTISPVGNDHYFFCSAPGEIR